MSNTLNGTVPGRGIIKGSLHVVYGKSAYDIAVANGFEGTEEEWLESISEDAAEVLAETSEYIFYGGDASGVPSAILSTEQIAEGLEQLEQIAEEVNQINEHLSDTDNIVENVKNSYGNRLTVNERDIELLGDDIDKLQQSTLNLPSRVDKCEDDIESLDEKIFEFRNDFDSRLLTAEDNIGRLETNITILQPPKMELDTEYAANEKCNDKTVYIKRIEGVSLAEAGSHTEINIGVGIVTLVDITIIIKSGTSNGGTYSRYKLPAFDVTTGNLMATFRLNTTATLTIHSFKDLSEYTADICIKYTKE